MKQLADEAEDVEMVDLVRDWNKKLIFTTEKLKKQYSQTSWAKDTRDTSGERPKPIFVKKETSFRESEHWYARQSPSTNNWGEDAEEEWPTGSFRERPQSRTRWSDQEQEQREEEGGEQSFIRGAYRDPFLHVLDKLANRMD